MPQLDITTYLITQDQPGGPMYFWEPEYPNHDEINDEGQMTLGRRIGLLLSGIIIVGIIVWLLTLIP